MNYIINNKELEKVLIDFLDFYRTNVDFKDETKCDKYYAEIYAKSIKLKRKRS